MGGVHVTPPQRKVKLELCGPAIIIAPCLLTNLCSIDVFSSINVPPAKITASRT
jgi:hypothetical protein